MIGAQASRLQTSRKRRKKDKLNDLFALNALNASGTPLAPVTAFFLIFVQSRQQAGNFFRLLPFAFWITVYLDVIPNEAG